MFKPGDIVTDLDPDSMYKGQQGEVIRVQLRFWQPPEVLVRFDRSLYLGHLRPDECPDGIYDVYPPWQLRKNPDWEPEVYARRLFGTRWHSIQTLRNPLNPNELCMVKTCEHHQKQIAWINIWGTVRNVYLCDICAAHYRVYSCMDSFPMRELVPA